ncbi:anaerobic sulfatase maturase [Gemmatimonadota bacterium]
MSIASFFHVMIKPRGPICNLDCSYCYYLSKEHLYPESDFRMTDKVLEKFTREYIQSQNVPEVIFGWQGGEPLLMGLDFFERAMRYQQEYARDRVRILNTIQTNGVLLDDDWCRFLRDNGFLVGISVDGPEHVHDAYRTDKGGKATFKDVMAGVDLLKKHNVEFNVLTTVHSANVGSPLDVYRFVRDEIGSAFVQFIPIVQLDNETGYQEGNRVTDRSVGGREYGEFLKTIFNEWVNRDVGKMFVQMFDVSLAAWTGQGAVLCIFAETCGAAMALEHNGDLYSCDHYVEPRNLLGNVMETSLAELAGKTEQQVFGRSKAATLPRHCRECEVRFVCNGGCPKNRILDTPDGEPGLNCLCEGYRSFFNHIDKGMRYMAGALGIGQPPAGIMESFAAEAYGDKAPD